MFIIDGLRFIETCIACPEQYDVKQGEVLVGYLRMRHGYFSVHYPNVGGEVVYEAEPLGDGCFENTAERMKHLRSAAAAINAAISKTEGE